MPGTLIRERTQRVARTLPTDTGVWFLAGFAEKGRSDTVHRIRNMAEFSTYVGARTTYSLVYDMADAFFGEGGSEMRFSRVFGPAPVTASATFQDAGAATVFTAFASSEGDWGNLLNVAIEAGDAGGEFKIRITHDTDTSINELSPSFVDAATAITAYSEHALIRLVAGASALDPVVVAAKSLASGTDDRANATDATWLAALTRMSKDLGPGQVSYAGRTTSVAQGQLMDHAANNTRVALLDFADTTSKATLIAAVASIRAHTNARFGAAFAPWVEIPALITGGSGRSIPPSAVVAGAIARNDSQGRSPNEPSAGDLGIVSYMNKLRANFNDVDANDLNTVNVNLIRDKYGQFKIYGYRTGAIKESNPLHWQFGNQRLYMAISALANNILERFVLRQIDGRKLVFKELEGQLAGMLGGFFERGSLFGQTPDEAFFVDTDTVNTTQTITNGEIHASIELTMSPMGETVILDIVRRAVAV